MYFGGLVFDEDYRFGLGRAFILKRLLLTADGRFYEAPEAFVHNRYGRLRAHLVAEGRQGLAKLGELPGEVIRGLELLHWLGGRLPRGVLRLPRILLALLVACAPGSGRTLCTSGGLSDCSDSACCKAKLVADEQSITSAFMSYPAPRSTSGDM